MISRIEVWHRGQAIPLRLFETSDTNSRHSFRVNSPRVQRFPLRQEISNHTAGHAY